MDALFERRELIRNVHIHSKFIQRNMASTLLAQLKMNFEGRCSSEGYVQPQSITILSYSLGRSNYVKGGIDYSVTFQADICLPHPGQVFKATVELRSKIGIHAMTPPIRVLIPRDLHIGNPEFESIEVGQEIEFEVADARFKQQDTDIVVVGRLRTALKPAPLQPLLRVETEVKLPSVTPTGNEPEEKTIVVSQVEPKKRKLKKPSVQTPNESLQIGVDEGTT
jgi:DNA-directed RNA polymerase subunit E'/Rpb7